MKYVFLISIIALSASILHAQEHPVNTYDLEGKLVNEQSQPVPDVVLQLLNASDSSLVKTEFSGEKGEFKFLALPEGNYFIQANAMGYANYLGQPFTLSSSITVAPFILKKMELELKEVTVSARKPYIERDHGKMILNVENSIASTGSSVFEVIEKAPGVRIDNNDNISLKGKQ